MVQNMQILSLILSTILLKLLVLNFFGSNYACVRDEFRMWPTIKPKKIVSNILIMFGGTDPTNKTIQTLKNS